MLKLVSIAAMILGAASAPNPDAAHDVTIYVHKDHIEVATQEKLYGIQFDHSNCDLKALKDHDLEIHNSDKVALAYSPVGKYIDANSQSKLFDISSDCVLKKPIAAGEKGRKLSVAVKHHNK